MREIERSVDVLDKTEQLQESTLAKSCQEPETTSLEDCVVHGMHPCTHSNQCVCVLVTCKHLEMLARLQWRYAVLVVLNIMPAYCFLFMLELIK